jgi:hypothetical protein
MPLVFTIITRIFKKQFWIWWHWWLLFISFPFFRDRISLCIPDWPRTHNSLASASQMLDLQVCTTTSSMVVILTERIQEFNVNILTNTKKHSSGLEYNWWQIKCISGNVWLWLVYEWSAALWLKTIGASLCVHHSYHWPYFDIWSRSAVHK